MNTMREALVRADVPRRVFQQPLVERGYGEVAFEVLGPRMVSATAIHIDKRHKVAALGIDAFDAERKLIGVVTRP